MFAVAALTAALLSLAAPPPSVAQEWTSIEASQSDESPKLSLLARNQSVEGLEPEPIGHGAVRTDLKGRFRHALVLRISPDGAYVIECVDSPEREAELLGVELQSGPEE